MYQGNEILPSDVLSSKEKRLASSLVRAHNKLSDRKLTYKDVYLELYYGRYRNGDIIDELMPFIELSRRMYGVQFLREEGLYKEALAEYGDIEKSMEKNIEKTFGENFREKGEREMGER